MSTLIEQINSFRDYAVGQAESQLEGRTLDDLYDEWRLLNPPSQQLQTDVRAVTASLDDMAGGETGQPLADFDLDFRQRNGLAETRE